MKVILQRVSNARISVNDEVVASIGKGIVALIGIHTNDTEKDVEYVSKKLLNLRVFEDSNNKRWAHSTRDLKLEVLCVSQFTLCHTLKGNKPDFRHAMGTEESKIIFQKLVERLRSEYDPSFIKEGVFGAHMVVSIENDGPVTLTFESPQSSSNTVEGST